MSDQEEEDLILGDDENPLGDIIAGQLEVIWQVSDIDNSDLYDDWKLHKTAAISRAMKIITKAQNIILKNLK